MGRLFDRGNVGAYAGRVERIRPGQRDVTLLDARAEDDQDVQVVSVGLTVQSAGTPAVPVLQAPTAHVEWGTGGGRDFVDVDFLQGTVLSVTASFVRVTATFPLADDILFGGGSLGPAFGETDPDDESQTLALGVTLGYHAHPQAAFATTPRLTMLVPVPSGPDGGVSEFIPVPKYARSVTVLVPPTFPPGELSIGAFTVENPAALLYGNVALPNLDVQAFPIARTVRFVRLTSSAEDAFVVPLLWMMGGL